MALSKKIFLTKLVTALTIDVSISSLAYAEINFRQFEALRAFKGCDFGENKLTWANWSGARAELCFDHG